MKKTTISISYDEEKLTTLKLYLDRKGIDIDSELVKSLDVLYMKNVPVGVREYIDLRSGAAEVATPKVKKPKPEQKNKTEVVNDEHH